MSSGWADADGEDVLRRIRVCVEIDSQSVHTKREPLAVGGGGPRHVDYPLVGENDGLGASEVDPDAGAAVDRKRAP
jgi:hypothetical protein